MKKLLMLGTSYGSVELVKSAKARGVYTIVTDYMEPEDSKAKLVADEYWMISTADMDALEKKCREEQVDGVFCGVSQFNIDKVLELCQRLGLPTYCTQEAWNYTKNKREFKDVCISCGVPVATDYYLTDELRDEDLDKVKLPVMVKPVDLSANVGISYCYTREEVKQAYRHARSVSENPTIVVERMLQGQEIAAVYALADGEASIIGFSASYSAPNEPKNIWSFVGTVTDALQPYLKEVDPAFRKAMKEMGCTEGIVWVQAILDQDGHCYLLEEGYRLGHGMLTNGEGFDYNNWMLDTALGVPHTPDMLPKSWTTLPYCGGAYHLWTNNDGILTEIQGVEELSKMPGFAVDFNLDIGAPIKRHQLVGGVTFGALDIDTFCKMLAAVNSKLHLKNERGEDLLIYFDDLDMLREVHRRSQETEKAEASL